MLSVSTKTGDQGESGLANGKRVAKDDLVFEVIGTLDEVNSWLGLVVAEMDTRFPDFRTFLLSIQDTLFYIGAEVAQSPKAKLKNKHLTELESNATELQYQLQDEWHTQFLLPGGTKLGATLDVSRSVCRRLERRMVALARRDTLNPVLIKYINRLSDYLYLLRVFVNHQDEYAEKKFSVK